MFLWLHQASDTYDYGYHGYRGYRGYQGYHKCENRVIRVIRVIRVTLVLVGFVAHSDVQQDYLPCSYPPVRLSRVIKGN